MATNPTIKPRRGTSAPGVGSIVQNELVVDTTNKRIYIGESDGSGSLIGSSPGGSNSQVQFNNSGNFGGSSGLVYNSTDYILTVSGAVSVSNQGTLRLLETTANGTEYVGIRAPSSLSNTNIYTFPSAVGSANQVLSIQSISGTNATLTWATVSGVGGSTSPGGSDGEVQFNYEGNFGGASGLIYDKSTSSLTVSGDLTVNGANVYLGGPESSLSMFDQRLTFSVGIKSTYITVNPDSTLIYFAIEPPVGTTGAPMIFGGKCDTYIGDYLSNGNDTFIFVDDSESKIKFSNPIGSTNTSTGTLLSYSDFGVQFQKDIRFYDSDNSHYVGFKSPSSVTSNRIWVLPSADGSINQVLKTDGSGNLGWTTAGGASAGGADTHVQFNDGGSTLSGEADFTWNKTSNTLSVNGNIDARGLTPIRFYDSDNSNYVGFRSPSIVSADNIWVLPSADGSTGQLLTTDGSDNLSWSTPPAIDLFLFSQGIV